MKRHEILLCSLDLIFIVLILFLLTFYSIKFDANKGVGDHDYVKINFLKTKNIDIEGDFQSFDYTAIVLMKNRIELYRYKNQNFKKVGSFSNVEKFKDSSELKADRIYVIYEVEGNDFLADITRLFAKQNIPIGIAQTL